MKNFIRRSALSTSSVQDLFVHKRNIILFDHAFNMKNYLEQFQLRSDVKSLKHPSSKHILSRYSSYFFNHSTYNYNIIGEFDVSLCGGEFYLPPSAKSIDSGFHGFPSNSIESSFHDLLILPEKIMIRNLTDEDIPAIFPMLSCMTHLTLDRLSRVKLSSGLAQVISLFPEGNQKHKVIIFNANKSYLPLEKCYKVTEWFENSICMDKESTKTLEDVSFANNSNFRYVIAHEFDSSIERHVQFLILPDDDSYTHINEKLVKEIVRKI
jgi:hypothetical protein